MNKVWLYVLVVVGFLSLAGAGYWAIDNIGEDDSAVENIEEVEKPLDEEEASVPHMLGCPCCTSA